jgi:hypothetical protein
MIVERPIKPGRDRTFRLTASRADRDFIALQRRQSRSLLAWGFTQSWIHTATLAQPAAHSVTRHANGIGDIVWQTPLSD